MKRGRPEQDQIYVVDSNGCVIEDENEDCQSAADAIH